MRLAGEQQVDGVSLEEAHEPRLVAQDEIAALVARGAPREADDHRLGPEVDAAAALDLLGELPLERLVRRPEGFVSGGRLDALRLPRRDVDAVGDGKDRRRLLDVSPHGARGPGVKHRHGVGPPGQLEPRDRHVEGISADRPHLGRRELEARPHVPEVGHRVLLVAGLDRGVGGEDDPPAHLLPCLGEREPHLHALGDHLDPGEHRVALVEVIGRDRDAEPVERSHPSDPEQHLLGDASVRPGLVEARRHPAIARPVRLDQVERRIAVAVGDPHRARDLDPSHPHPHPHAGLAQEAAVVGRELIVRLALGVDPLDAVAALPSQPDRDQRELEIVCRLDEVSGQDAEAARVDGERLVETELHAEVSDVGRAWHAGSAGDSTTAGVDERGILEAGAGGVTPPRRA